MSEDFAAASRLAWHLAASVLGWRAADFWEATPRELAGALVPPDDPAGPPDRDTIEALKRRFPDRKEQDEPGY